MTDADVWLSSQPRIDTVVTGFTGRPFFAARKVNTIHAKIALNVTPASSTIIRFQIGLSSKKRPGGTCSSAVSSFPFPSRAALVASSSLLAIFT